MNKQKRKQTEDFILKYIDKIAPGGANKKLYEDMFAKMPQADFTDFMTKLQKGEVTLSIIAPNSNGNKGKISVENNFKIAKTLGVNFFQHLIIKGDRDLPPYKTPNKYYIGSLPIKRASQLLSKKASIPKDSKSIDLTTGQVTGKSAAAKLTFPEIQLLAGVGLEHSIVELLKHRGGDLGSGNAMSKILYANGRVTQDQINPYATGVTSTKTLKNYWRASHISSTLGT